jgi:hypothetical protein
MTQDQEVYKMRMDGKSFADIAHILGWSNYETRKAFEREKYPLNKRNLSKENVYCLCNSQKGLLMSILVEEEFMPLSLAYQKVYISNDSSIIDKYKNRIFKKCKLCGSLIKDKSTRWYCSIECKSRATYLQAKMRAKHTNQELQNLYNLGKKLIMDEVKQK